MGPRVKTKERMVLMTIIEVTSNPDKTSALVKKNFDDVEIEDIINVSNAPLSMADTDEAILDRNERTSNTVDQIMASISRTRDDIAVVIDVDNVALSSYLVLSTCVKVNVDPPQSIIDTICEHTVDIMIPIDNELVSFD